MYEVSDLQRRENYVSFLLRMWHDGEASGWHVSLQDTESLHKLYFANLELLVDFLYRKTELTQMGGERCF
jgi:hypothetical protein